MSKNHPVPVARISGDIVPDKATSFYLRTHHDGLGDAMSAITATVNEDPSETQTQFTAECDINNILDRYTRGQLPEQRPVKFGETIDYSMDLQNALDAVSDMKHAHAVGVPPELQNLYPDWQSWVNAAANGSYEHELANLAEKKKRVEEDAAIIKAHREGKPSEKETPNPSEQGKDKKPD